jgi:hypothetical protein
VGARASLDVLRKRKISCPCWDLYPGSSSSQTSYCTGCTTLNPDSSINFSETEHHNSTNQNTLQCMKSFKAAAKLTWEF